LSYHYAVSTGATIVLLCTGFFAIAVGVQRIRQYRGEGRS
jgi:ABC-type Mn2+/Zn2+ transport system permease subunit